VSGNRVIISILMAAHPFPDVDIHISICQVNFLYKCWYCGNQVFILPATDGIYLVGGIEEDLLHLAQRFTGSGIAGSEAHQLLIEENAVRKMAVSAADGHRLTLE